MAYKGLNREHLVESLPISIDLFHRLEKLKVVKVADLFTLSDKKLVRVVGIKGLRELHQVLSDRAYFDRKSAVLAI